MSERVFYTSENGNEWLLSYGSGVLADRHQPNAASGGESGTMELGAFLQHEQHSAQNQKLVELIATLIVAPPVSSEEQVLKTYDLQSAREGLVRPPVRPPAGQIQMTRREEQ